MYINIPLPAFFYFAVNVFAFVWFRTRDKSGTSCFDRRNLKALLLWLSVLIVSTAVYVSIYL